MNKDQEMNFKKRLEKLESKVKLKANKKPISCIILSPFQSDGNVKGEVGWRRCDNNRKWIEFSDEEKLEA